MKDENLVKLFVESNGRNLAAFNAIVDRYQALVTSSSHKYLRNSELAEEVTQDVFMKVFSKLHTINNPSQLKSWILRITQNTCSDFYHKQKKQKELRQKVKVEIDHNKPLETDEHSKEDQRMEALINSIQQLKANDREVIQLHYFSDMKVAEIAQELGIKESAVKMRLVRCRDKLLNKINIVTQKRRFKVTVEE